MFKPMTLRVISDTQFDVKSFKKNKVEVYNISENILKPPHLRYSCTCYNGVIRNSQTNPGPYCKHIMFVIKHQIEKGLRPRSWIE